MFSPGALRRSGALARLAGRPVALAALVLVVLLSACTPRLWVDPRWIDPQNRPTDVAGQSNGALSDDRLVTIDAECRISRDAAYSLRQLLDAARADGVPLAPSDCYRSYAGQVMWRLYWCNLGLCAMAAVPGTSKHGWAKAVDFGDGGRDFTFSSPGYRWMQAHGAEFGFVHPAWAEPLGSGPEPWHWEWVGDGGVLFPPTGALAHYWDRGGPLGPLGPTLGPARLQPDGIGAFLPCEHGAVFQMWGPGTHEVHGDLYERYLVEGGPKGPLGHPVSDEWSTSAGGTTTRISSFEAGAIYSTPVFGVHVLSGPVYERYLAEASSAGPLGAPIGDVVTAGDGSQQAAFERGSILFRPGAGTEVTLV